jgi:hypothetical protein
MLIRSLFLRDKKIQENQQRYIEERNQQAVDRSYFPTNSWVGGSACKSYLIKGEFAFL